MVMTAGIQPKTVVDHPPKCWRCGRALAEYAGRPWSIKCRRCHAENRSKD